MVKNLNQEKLKEAIGESEPCHRVKLALDYCVKPALLQRLLDANVGNLPTNPADVHNLLKTFEQNFKKTLPKIKDIYWNTVVHKCDKNCPKTCPKKGVTNIESHDISALCTTFRNMDKISSKADINSLRNFLQHVASAEKIRNEYSHDQLIMKTEKEFDEVWERIKRVLKGLKYDDMPFFKELKTCTMDNNLEEKLENLQIQVGIYDKSDEDGFHSHSLHQNIRSKTIANFFLLAPNDGQPENVHHHCISKKSKESSESEQIILEIYHSGAAAPLQETMTLDQLDTRALEYNDRVIADGKKVEIYPHDYVFHPPLSEDVTHICSHIEHQLEESSDNTSVPSIIRGYSPLYHYGLFKKNASPIKHDRINRNNIIVLSPDDHICLLLKVCDKENLINTFEVGNRELLVLTEMYGSGLRDSNLSICLLVACTDVTAEGLDLDDYSYIDPDYKKLIITKEAIENVDEFHTLWDFFLCSIETMEQYYKDVVNTDPLTIIHRQIKAIMATTDVQLPSLGTSTTSKMATILLQRQQLELVESNSKHKIGLGTFGSGKSIAAQVIIRKMAKEPGTLVYYILCASQSIFLSDMDIFVSKNSLQEKARCTNIYSICKEVGHEDCTDLFEVIQAVLRFHNYQENIHFVFDEVDLEWLTPQKACKLRQLTTNNNTSQVVLLARNMTKNRTLFKGDEIKPYDINSYQETGFQVFLMKSTIRCTNSINDLYRNTEATISSAKPDTTYHPNLQTEVPIQSTVNSDENSTTITVDEEEIDESKHLRGIESITSGKTSDSTSPEKCTWAKCLCWFLIFLLMYIKRFLYWLFGEDGGESSNQGMEDFKTDVLMTPMKQSPSEEISLQIKPRMNKSLEDLRKDLNANYSNTESQKTESTISYNKSVNGIKITGEKPTLFWLPEEGGANCSTNILRVLLKKEIKKLKHRHAIILCINVPVAKLVAKCIKDVKFTFYLGEGSSDLESLRGVNEQFKKTRLMITTVNGFRSGETQNVFLILDSNNQYDKHLVSEMVSRATVNLKIMLIPGEQSDDASATSTSTIVDNWVNEDLVQTPNITYDDFGEVFVNGEKYGNLTNNGIDGNDDDEVDDESCDKADIEREFFDGYGDRLENPARTWDGNMVHEVIHEGIKYNFDAMYKMAGEDKEKFMTILTKQPHIINTLRNDDKWTLLMKTIPVQDFERFEYMALFPQDFGCVSKSIRNVFHHAAWNNDDVAFQFANTIIKLMEGNKRKLNSLLNVKDKVKWIPIHNAARRNNHKTQKLYLANGCNPNAKNRHGLRPDDLADVDEMTKSIFREFRIQNGYDV